MKKYIYGIILLFIIQPFDVEAVKNQDLDSNKKNQVLRILLIGDSVSVGYRETVSRLLKGDAEVYYNPGSARDTKYGLDHIEEWIGKEKWDLIYVNFGLDDIKIQDPVPYPEGNWGEEGGIKTLSMEYEDRLRKIASILTAQQTTVVWATITPVPENKFSLLRYWGGGENIPKGVSRWFPRDVDSYNGIACRIMREWGIYIHDLNREILPLQDKIQKENSPYFTEEGYNYIGKLVADYISEKIKPAQKPHFSDNVVTILDTDIGPWLDIDDWFDVLMYSSSELNHGGIIMEHYASDWEEASLQRFMKWLGREDIPVRRGAQTPVKYSEGTGYSLPKSQAGADLILSTMRNSEQKVRVVCVGALTNVATAYLKDTDLFMNKIESVWFCGGMLNGYEDAHSSGRWDTNIERDKVAAGIIFNNKIPIVWFPVSLEMIVRSDRRQEEAIRSINSPVIKWLYEGVDYWHERRGESWERETGQEKGGERRLWSVTVHATLNDQTDCVEFEKGWAAFSPQRWSTFIKDPNGKDWLLVKIKKKELSNWYKEHIISFFK